MQAEYNTWKSNTNSKIKQMDNAIPSFAGDTITLEVDKKHKLTDSDGHLEDYPTVNKAIDGIRIEHTKGSNDLYITATDTCTSENYTFKSESAGLFLHYGGSTSKVYILDGNLQRTTYTNYYPVDPFFRLRLNIKLNGGLTIKKINNNGDSLAGCTFRIWSEDTGYSSSEVTPENGIITIDSLKTGIYHVKETSASAGYLQNETIYDVEVRPGEKAETNILTVTNQEPTGQITVTKKNSNGDILGAGFKFKITATDKITNKTGTVTYYNKGDVVANLTTGSNGTASKSDLPLGKYTITETDVVSGYLLNKEPKTVTLTYKDPNTDVIYTSISISNDEPIGELEINKTDKETGNNERVDGTVHHGDASLKGATYTLYADEDIYNVAKTVKYFSQNEKIGTFTFNERGIAVANIINTVTKAKISANASKITGLPMGNYRCSETIVPEGYTQDNNIYRYSFEYKDQNTKVIPITGTVENIVQKAPFEVIKVSTNSNSTAEVVPDAEFTAILSKYVKYYGSFDEAKKHLNEFAEDEYSIFTTQENGHRNFWAIILWRIYRK